MGTDLLIAAGGTGGHIFPALAVAEEAVERGWTVRFAGTAERMESSLVPRAGFEMDCIRAYPVIGRGALGAASGLAAASFSVLGAARVLGKVKPRVVLGAGGFVSAPVVAAARLLRIPAVLLEQNVIPGHANRMLGRFMTRVLVTYASTAAFFPPGKGVHTGNPVRKSVVAKASTRDPNPNGRVRILVLGGSQGASSINDQVPKAFQAEALRHLVTIVHQAGPGRREPTESAYRDNGVEARVVEFIEDMGAAYAAADLILCRSGATTIAEVAVAGLPAVFVPYPHHRDRQQELNARPFAEAGAAVILNEPLEPDVLGDVLEGLAQSPGRREAMSRAMRGLARPDAAGRVVDILEELR